MALASRLDRRSLIVLLLVPLVVLGQTVLGSGTAAGQSADPGVIPVTMFGDRADTETCEISLSDESPAGDCSLREAVILANDSEGFHTVVLGEGTFELTIPGAADDDGRTGDLDVTDDLTIVGAGSAVTTIVAEWDLDDATPQLENGNGDEPSPDRLLHVAANGTTLTLEGLTLEGGEATPGDGDEACDETRSCDGGAILLGGARMMVLGTDEAGPAVNGSAVGLVTDDVVVRDSRAAWNGGGIAALAAEVSLDLSDTVVSGNRADRSGGGIFVEGESADVLLDGTRVGGHEPVQAGEVQEGGNRADRNGGGISIQASELDVEASDSQVVGNLADDEGGGAWIAQDADGRIRVAAAEASTADLVLRDSLVDGNHADFSGGLYLAALDAHLSGTTVSGNTASGGAGGMNLQPGGYWLDAVSDDAAAAQEEQRRWVHLEDSTISANAVTSWGSGGVNAFGVDLTASDSTVADNEGQQVGGLWVAGDVDLERVAIRDNRGDWRAGGLSVDGGIIGPGTTAGDVRMVDSSVTGNVVGFGGAAGVRLDTGSYLYAAGAGPEEGHVEPQYYHDLPPYEVAIEGSTFADNGQDPSVGGAADEAGALVAPGEGAGALWVARGYQGSISNSTFSGNEAVAGAGMRMGDLAEGGLDLTHVTFAGNDLFGDGAPAVNGSEPGPAGAAIHVDDHYDMYSNGGDGPGDLRLSHTAVADSDRNCGGDLDRLISLGHNLDDDGTCQLDEAGDVVADAQLGPLSDNGGHTLTHVPAAASPAVNGGTAAPCDVDVDQRGTSRPQGDACDIGAVEVEHDPDPEEPVQPDPRRPFGCDPDAADRFPDVHPDGVHRDNIGCAADLGFVVGFVDGSYRPGIDMSRGQFATVVARMVEFILDDELPVDDAVTFPDVPAGHVHEDGIRKLATAGLVVGFEDGDYRPGHSLRRGQAASILDAAITTSTGEQLPDGPTAFLDHRGSPHEHALDRLAQEGIVTGYGDGTVRPSLAIQRGQLASMVVRTLVAIEGIQVGTD
jgi:hypothetical protein